MAITVTQLTAFLAVTRGGSVTAAADELVVTQPSVSSAIAALGRELGCDLFERSGRGIRLTEAGQAFEPFAADVIGMLDKGRQAAREAAAVVERRLRIAAVTTAAESFVPPLMRSFAGQHPQVELVLDVGNREEVLERLRAHVVDVAFSGTPPSDDRLIAEPLMDNEIVCIAAPDDPALASGPCHAADLAQRLWLLREPGSGTRALNEQFFSERALSPATLTLGSNGAIKQAARVGLGVSLLSRAAVEVELASGRLGEVELLDGPACRPWFVLRSAVGPAARDGRAVRHVRARCRRRAVVAPWRDIKPRAAGQVLEPPSARNPAEPRAAGQDGSMSGFTDIHAHVLPGIDDGPEQLERSLEMLRAAVGAGTSVIAATPHLRSDFPDVHVTELADRCHELRSHAEREAIEIGLVPGAEVSLVWALEATEEDLSLATYGQRGSDLLIETPQLDTAILERGLNEISQRGFRITLAHPERSSGFQQNPAELSSLVAAGVLLQVNAESLLTTRRAAPPARLGRYLCTEGLAHALASDGHRGESWRPVTQLAAGVEAAAALVGSARAQWMAAGVPAAIIAGSPLPDPPPIIAPQRKARIRLWR